MSTKIKKILTSASKGEAIIYVVATPIGNLEDLSPRARRILTEVDVIAAEDTRETRKLLNLIGIEAKEIISYHDHGEAERAVQLIKLIQERGQSLALVSDAGTPCISDPGYRLVNLARQAQIKVHPIPGASALTALASVSGLPTNRLLFVGFLPPKSGAMKREMQSWRATRASIVFFESTRRLAKTLIALKEVYPAAKVAVGRELTKLFEEVVTLEIDAALKWADGHSSLKGEAVVMVDLSLNTNAESGVTDNQTCNQAGSDMAAGEVWTEWTEARIRDRARIGFAEGLTVRDLLAELLVSGMNRTDLYQLLLQIKKNPS